MTDKLRAAEVELLPCPFCGAAPMFCPDDSYGACTIWCSCPAEPSVQAEKDGPDVAAGLWNSRHRPDATPAPGEVERLSVADSRQIRMAVAAWLEGRRDAEFWLGHIHVTLGSPSAAALKQASARAALHPQEKRGPRIPIPEQGEGLR